MNDAASTGPGRNLVFLCDGTLSSISRGEETNVGLIYRLLTEGGDLPQQRVDYDRGVQGTGWRKWLTAATGEGINRSILAGYRFLASRYRPGDRIFLLGYSRGAYAMRSLAGMIGQVGLLRAPYASRRGTRLAFHYYERGTGSTARRAFTSKRCHPTVEIEMVGLFDTVKSLGLPYPVLSRLAPFATEFHDDQLGAHIRHGYHALALDEDRTAYEPLLWQASPDWRGRVEQAWFPGAHGDVGGEVRACPSARPLANVALNWMLRRAARHGLSLPDGWEILFPEDAAAPAMGPRRGIARLFLSRARRQSGIADGETVHLSVRDRMARVRRYRPRAVAPEFTESPA
ncbi:MAG: DUF2235 domain-containing protein [Pseudomonadota bacterium]